MGIPTRGGGGGGVGGRTVLQPIYVTVAALMQAEKVAGDPVGTNAAQHALIAFRNASPHCQLCDRP